MSDTRIEPIVEQLLEKAASVPGDLTHTVEHEGHETIHLGPASECYVCHPVAAAIAEAGNMDDWPRCTGGCGRPALDGATCGAASCRPPS